MDRGHAVLDEREQHLRLLRGHRGGMRPDLMFDFSSPIDLKFDFSSPVDLMRDIVARKDHVTFLPIPLKTMHPHLAATLSNSVRRRHPTGGTGPGGPKPPPRAPGPPTV
jgi:hypothetical protein